MCVAAGQPDAEVSGAFPHCGMDPEGSAASSSLGTSTLLPSVTSNIPIYPIYNIQNMYVICLNINIKINNPNLIDIYIYKIRIIYLILCSDST